MVINFNTVENIDDINGYYRKLKAKIQKKV